MAVLAAQPARSIITMLTDLVVTDARAYKQTTKDLFSN